MKPIILLALVITACSSHVDDQKKEPPKKSSFGSIQGEFKSKQYQISDHEHITVYDMPDRILPQRCWVFTDDKINQSHMRCGVDASGELPEYTGSLDK